MKKKEALAFRHHGGKASHAWSLHKIVEIAEDCFKGETISLSVLVLTERKKNFFDRKKNFSFLQREIPRRVGLAITISLVVTEKNTVTEGWQKNELLVMTEMLKKVGLQGWEGWRWRQSWLFGWWQPCHRPAAIPGEEIKQNFMNKNRRYHLLPHPRYHLRSKHVNEFST